VSSESLQGEEEEEVGEKKERMPLKRKKRRKQKFMNELDVVRIGKTLRKFKMIA
jgi:hypothetical protein